MLDFLGKFKSIAFVIIFIFVFFVLRSIFAPTETKDLLIATIPSDTENVSHDLIVLLSQINSIRFDNELFKDEVFRSLKDLGLEVIPQPSGRNNPFAPLDGTVTKI